VSETTPDSELLAAVDRVTAALGGVRDDLKSLRRELETARKDVRRSQNIITGLVISFCLDLAVTGLVGWNTIRVNDTQDASRASAISACRQANVNRRQDIAIWDRFLDDIAPPAARAKTTPKVRAELTEINRLIRVKDAPRNCVVLYSNSP
jgi:hypothetical protein